MSIAFRVALAVSAALGFWLLSDAHRGAYDFQAFYCAGTVLREHGDPYRTQPLRSCEHEHTDGTYAALPPGVALPAPQPAYDLAVFALLSLLPFAAAKALWGAVLGSASAIAIAAAARMSGVSPAAAFMAFAASLILPSFAFGQLFALYAAACCVAALLAQRGAWTLAGIAAAGTLVEPHLGLPLCAALAIYNARARYALLIAASTLVAIALLAARGNVVEYALATLPLHALSEIHSDAQLSLTAVAHALGATEMVSLRLGVLSYVIAGAAGIGIGVRLAARTGNAAFVIAVPAALAAAGGTFIHATELLCAVPLALLLIRVARVRLVGCIALVLVSVPWFTVLDGGMPLAFAVTAAAVVFFELWQLGGVRMAYACACALFACALLLAAPSWFSHAPAADRASSPRIAALYPQASWRALTDERLSGGTPITWVLRAGSWCGLLLAGCGAFSLAFARGRLSVNVN